MYDGKEGNKGEKWLGIEVVKLLTNNLHELGHIVFHDNYFTSVELVESLLEDTIYACGTAKMDRRYTVLRFPTELSHSKLKQRLEMIILIHTHAIVVIIQCMKRYLQSPTFLLLLNPTSGPISINGNLNFFFRVYSFSLIFSLYTNCSTYVAQTLGS